MTEQRQVLLRLRVRDFRNLHEVDFSPGPRVNVLAGDNGQGKSNLLEAIDYLGTLRSFRGAQTDELVAEHADQAEIGATVGGDGLPHEHKIRLSRSGRRQVQLDGKRPRSRAAYALSMPVVIFHPGDLHLTTGAAEPRRVFLDRVLERLDETYAETLAAYTRALASRNRLLKADVPNRLAIGAYDELLASAGSVLGQARSALVAELGPRVSDFFAEISGEDAPQLSLRYEPRVEPTVPALRRALTAAIDKDLARGFTADGPHGDELMFRLHETKARRYASQGQHRAIVLALKVAELQELEHRTGRTPILLLDDVSSELDSERNRRFFALLARLGGQVFLTTTQPKLILVEAGRMDFQVKAGCVTAVTAG